VFDSVAIFRMSGVGALQFTAASPQKGAQFSQKLAAVRAGAGRSQTSSPEVEAKESKSKKKKSSVKPPTKFVSVI